MKTRASLPLIVPDVPDDDGHLCRRGFLGLASGAALCALLAPALAACEVGEVLGAAPVSLDFDLANPRFAALASVGGIVSVDSGPKQILLLRTSDADVIAINRICTHQGCDLDPSRDGGYAPSTMEILCRCHGARFSSTGMVLRGPARQDLVRHAVMFDPQTGKGTVHFS